MKVFDALLGRYLYGCSCGSGGGGIEGIKVVTATITGDGSYFDFVSMQNEFGQRMSVFQAENGFFEFDPEISDGETKVYRMFYTGDSVSVLALNTVTNLSGNATYDSDTSTLTVTGDFEISGYYD